VAGLLGPETDEIYQSEPPAVVIEILSPSDRFTLLQEVPAVCSVGRQRHSGVRSDRPSGVALGRAHGRPDPLFADLPISEQAGR
jgi:hypothetical protein